MCPRVLAVFRWRLLEHVCLCVLLLAGGLHNSVAKLLSRVVCQKSVPTAVWEACAHFHLKSTKPADAIKVFFTDCCANVNLWRVKGVAELQKAQRMCRQKSGWEREWQSLVRVSRLTLDYSRGAEGGMRRLNC